MLKTIKDGLLVVAVSMLTLQLTGCGRVNDQNCYFGWCAAERH